MYPKLPFLLLLLSLLVLQNDGFSFHVGFPRRAPHVVSQLMTLESKDPVGDFNIDVQIGGEANSSADSPVSVDGAIMSGMALASNSKAQGLNSNKGLISGDSLSEIGGNLNFGANSNGQPESVVDSESKLDNNASAALSDSVSSAGAGTGILSASGERELSSGNNDSSVLSKFENAGETGSPITADRASDDRLGGAMDGTSNSSNSGSLNVAPNIKDALLNSSLYSGRGSDSNFNNFKGFLGLNAGNANSSDYSDTSSSSTVSRTTVAVNSPRITSSTDTDSETTSSSTDGSEEAGKSTDLSGYANPNSSVTVDSSLNLAAFGAAVMGNEESKDNGNYNPLKMLGKLQSVANSEGNISGKVALFLDKDNSESVTASESRVTSSDSMGNATFDLYLTKSSLTNSSDLIDLDSKPVELAATGSSANETESLLNSDRAKAVFDFLRSTLGTPYSDGTASEVVDASLKTDSSDSLVKLTGSENTESSALPSDVVSASTSEDSDTPEDTTSQKTNQWEIHHTIPHFMISEWGTNIDDELVRLFEERRRFFSTEETIPIEVTDSSPNVNSLSDVQMPEETGSPQTRYVGAEGVTPELSPRKAEESGDVTNPEIPVANDSASSDLGNLESDAAASGAVDNEKKFDGPSEVNNSGQGVMANNAGRLLLYPSDSVKINDSLLGVKLNLDSSSKTVGQGVMPNPVSSLKGNASILPKLSFSSSESPKADDIVEETTTIDSASATNAGKNTGSLFVFTSTNSPAMVNSDITYSQIVRSSPSFDQQNIAKSQPIGDAPFDSSTGTDDAASDENAESLSDKSLKQILKMVDYDALSSDLLSRGRQIDLAKRSLSAKDLFEGLFPDVNKEPVLDSFGKYDFVAPNAQNDQYPMLSDTETTNESEKKKILLNASEESSKHSQTIKTLFRYFAKCYENHLNNMKPGQMNMSEKFGDFLEDSFDVVNRCYAEAERRSLESENSDDQSANASLDSKLENMEALKIPDGEGPSQQLRLTIQDMVRFALQMALEKKSKVPKSNAVVSLLSEILPSRTRRTVAYEENSRPTWVMDGYERDEGEMIETDAMEQDVETISTDDNGTVRGTFFIPHVVPEDLIRPSEDSSGLKDNVSGIRFLFGPVSQDSIDKDSNALFIPPGELPADDPTTRKEISTSTVEVIDPFFYPLDGEDAPSEMLVPPPEMPETPLLDSNVPGDLPSMDPAEVTRNDHDYDNCQTCSAKYNNPEPLDVMDKLPVIDVEEPNVVEITPL